MNIANPNMSFQPIQNLLLSSIAAKALLAAVEFKLFDNLKNQSMNVETLAHKLSAIPERLEPVLDILVSTQLLSRRDSAYTNTPLANEFLVSDSPCYQGDCMALTMNFCNGLENSIPDLLMGKQLDKKAADTDWATEQSMKGTEQEAIANGLAEIVDYIAALPNFANATSMCDIGGNHGLYTMAILDRNPALQGKIYDLPHVIPHTQNRCNEAGFESRITTCALDLGANALPPNEYDLIFTSHLLYAFKHQLADALQKIANSLKPNGWFVSHHNAGQHDSDNEIGKSSLELITRLSGYASHFIEEHELIPILHELGFHNIQMHRTSNASLGLILAAQKKA